MDLFEGLVVGFACLVEAVCLFELDFLVELACLLGVDRFCGLALLDGPLEALFIEAPPLEAWCFILCEYESKGRRSITANNKANDDMILVLVSLLMFIKFSIGALFFR